jgi:hypothetical protein
VGSGYWVENKENSSLWAGRKRIEERIRKIGDVGKLDQEIEEEFLVWRIWYEKGTPPHELRNEWTYEDLLKANSVLDMYGAMDIAGNYLDEQELKSKTG